MTVRGYTLGADWSGYGNYAGTLEDLSAYLLDDTELVVAVGREGAQATLHAPSGSMDFQINNLDRQFSPENTSSPIAGRVTPGRAARLLKQVGATIYNLLDGVIDSLSVDSTAPAKTLSVNVLDAWGRPGAEKLSTPLYSGLRTGAAINLVLDAIGWTGGRDIDPGATLIPWWWVEGDDAATAVDKLVDSEGPPAIAYVQGGVFVFRDRHHRILRSGSTTSQGTFTHVVPAGSGPVGEFKVEGETFTYDHGVESVANTVAFTVPIRKPAPFTEVWVTEDPITMSVGESIEVQAEASDPFLDAIITCTVDYGNVAVAQSRDSGQSLVITLVASTNALVSKLAVVARPVAVTRSVKISASDAGSVAQYRQRTWPIEAPWANHHDAKAIALRIIAVYATNRPTVTFTVVGLDDRYLATMMALKISDRITVRNDKRGINGDFAIERLSHRITKLGLIHRLTITAQAVEPTQPANVFTFNVAGKGFNDGLFAIDGVDSAATVFRFDVPGKGFNDAVFGT